MKKIVSLLLIATFILSCSLSAFALDTTNSSSAINEKFDLVETITEISSSLGSSPNSLYTASNIAILENNDKYQEVQVIEGSKVNTLSYDIVNDKLYVDGNLITVIEVMAPLTDNLSPTALGNAFDHSYTQINYGKAIVNFTSAGLAAVIVKVLGTDGTVAANLARAILQTAGQSSYLYCSATYCHSYKRLDDSYYFYNKYWDMYWDSSYSDFCTSYYQTIYQ